MTIPLRTGRLDRGVFKRHQDAPNTQRQALTEELRKDFTFNEFTAPNDEVPACTGWLPEGTNAPQREWFQHAGLTAFVRHTHLITPLTASLTL